MRLLPLLLLLAACTPTPPPGEAERVFTGCLARADDTLRLLACGPDLTVELRPLQRDPAAGAEFLDGLRKGYGGDWLDLPGTRALRRTAHPPETPRDTLLVDAVLAPAGTLRGFGKSISFHCLSQGTDARCREIIMFLAHFGFPEGLTQEP